METRAARFFATWLLICLLLAASMAIFNLAIDPYLVFGVPRVAGFNARKPAVLWQEQMMKAYDVARARPKTVLIGSSRVGLGLDARHFAWPAQERPVYNLAIGGGDLYVAYRNLQNVMAQGRLESVVVGLDFEHFLLPATAEHYPQRQAFELRFEIQADGSTNTRQRRQYLRDVIQATFSIDALEQSLATLRANLAGRSFDLNAGNVESVERIANAYSRVMWSDLGHVRQMHSRTTRQLNPQAMMDLRKILELCESHSTRATLLINPVHADYLEIWDTAGYWPVLEDWKRQLVALTTEHRERAVLWDFTGYSSYSTESVPVDGRDLRYFWEPAHYTPELGDLIVRRILGSSDASFGAILTPESLESDLATIRTQQQLYRRQRQVDVQRVRDLQSTMIGTPPLVAATGY